MQRGKWASVVPVSGDGGGQELRLSNSDVPQQASCLLPDTPWQPQKLGF